MNRYYYKCLRYKLIVSYNTHSFSQYFDSDKDGFVNEDNLCTLTDAALSSDNLHSPAIKFPESPWNFG